MVYFAANLQVLLLHHKSEIVSAQKMMLVDGSWLADVLPSHPWAGDWPVVMDYSILRIVLARNVSQYLSAGTLASQPVLSVFSASHWLQDSKDVPGSFLDCQDVSPAS